MKYIIYKLTRDDGQIYIGTTDNRHIKKRLYDHKRSKRFNKYSFTVEILEENNDITIHDKEQYYIKKFDSYNNGLNDTIDGKGNHNAPNFTTRGYKFSKESRKRMSISAKRRFENGEIPWNKNKKDIYSKETLENISKSQKKRFRDNPQGKLTIEIVKYIRAFFESRPEIKNPKIGKIQRNGKILPYNRAFAQYFNQQFNITDVALYNIIIRKSWKNV